MLNKPEHITYIHQANLKEQILLFEHILREVFHNPKPS